MEKKKMKKDIMECRERLSEYGIKLENGMRTLRITARCVPQAEDMKADDPLEHFLFDGRSRRHDGRWDEGYGLIRILRRYSCLTDMDYVLNPEYWDEEYASCLDELVYGKSGAYTVPATVTRIGEMAFMDCRELTQIDISHPDTVIEERAFFRCEKLERVVFRGSGSVKHIGESAFHCCKQLSKVPLNKVKSIGDFAFFACEGLRVVRVPQSCECIEEKAFDSCNRLDFLIVPKALADFKYSRWGRNKKTYRDFEATWY